MRKILFPLCLFLLVSCAHQGTNIPQYPVIPLGKAAICFYQPRLLPVIKPLDLPIHEGDRVLRATPPGTFWFYECDPGTHHFWIEGENRAAVYLDVAPQGHYFIKYGFRMKGLFKEVFLERVSAIEGDADIHQLVFAGTLK